MYFLPSSLIFISFSILTFIYVFKNKKEKIEKHLFVNEFLLGLLLLMAGIFFPFMYQFHSLNIPSETLNYLWFSTSTLLLIEIGIWGCFLTYNAFISKKTPDIMAQRDYNEFCEEFKKNWVYDFKSDIGRKFLHLFTVFVIFFFWTLGTILENLGFLAPWGLDTYSFSFWLIITIGYGFCAMFMMGDLARLNKFCILPNWAKKWYASSMRHDELETFVASTPLVLAFIPIIFFPFPIFAASTLIATVADAAAALIGMKYGKHKFKEQSKKTIEGYIAGILTSFFIVIIIMILYHEWMPVNISLILAMAIIAALLFFLIDMFSNNMCDNILNPILTGLGMWMIYFIFS